MQIGWVVVVAGVLGVAAAGVLIVRLRAELRELEGRAAELAGLVDALPADLATPLGNGTRHVIAVELLNPFELAQRETWLAKPLSVLTPRVLRDLIYRQVVSRVRQTLTDAGVRADVRLHRAGRAR